MKISTSGNKIEAFKRKTVLNYVKTYHLYKEFATQIQNKSHNQIKGFQI